MEQQTKKLHDVVVGVLIITNGLRANTVKCGCGHSMVLYVALELGCNKTYFGGLAPIVRGTKQSVPLDHFFVCLFIN